MEKNTICERIIQGEPKSGTHLSLPNEILIKVFKQLTVEDLIQCFNTSQRWRDVARFRLYHLKQPDSLQFITKYEFWKIKIFRTLNEKRFGGVLICMPKGIYLFGGYEPEFTKNPFHPKNGPLTSKFLEKGSNVWENGPEFAHNIYPGCYSIHDAVKDYKTFEFSAGHKISNEEFILVLNRHVFKYNIASKNWSYVVKLKYSRQLAGSMVFEGKLIITGGSEIPHLTTLDTTEIVDLSSGRSWIGGNLNIPRFLLKMDIFNVDGKLRIGTYGRNYRGEPNSQMVVEIWHEEDESWKIHSMESGNMMSKKLIQNLQLAEIQRAPLYIENSNFSE